MKKEIAKILLEIKAVHLQPNNFFTWTSGIKSPIYCDNRQIISFPSLRKKVVASFIQLIKEQYHEVEVIAGTATAGIPWAAWIADELGLPMIYIRSNSKGHGLQNSLEGKYSAGQKVLVIEDLISTGKSSIQAAIDAKDNELDVLAVLSIFNYGFYKALKAFQEADIPFSSLCSLSDMLKLSLEENLLSSDQVDIIKEWKKTVEN
jgi:orotate phosphoribosyltransferase